MSTIELPPLMPRDRLADACRETADEQRLQPAAVEKDYYLTRLITALAAELGSGTLLKGGTLLSKVDLGFNRMSEDVDLVCPALRTRANVRMPSVSMCSGARCSACGSPWVLTFQCHTGSGKTRTATSHGCFATILNSVPNASSSKRQSVR